jgi:hypothetical protein
MAGSIFDGATMALICEVALKEIVETPKTSSETELWLNFTESWKLLEVRSRNGFFF